VIQLNRAASSSPTVVQPVVITGTPSGTPTLPPLTQTPTGLFQIPVSYWTSASAGSLSGLVDQRQFAGRSVVSMFSTNHPSPPNPCLGIEVDTGHLLVWNGTTWSFAGPQTQSVQGGNTNNTASYMNMHTPFNIPANDPVANTKYRLQAGGHGQQASGTPQVMYWQVVAYGLPLLNTGMSTTPAGAGGNFHWSVDAEIIIGVPGTSTTLSSWGTFTWSYGSSTTTTVSFAADTQLASGVNTTAATTIAFQTEWASITGTPNIVCTGATLERVSP
jgi:hypothetical protein